jgi:DNA-binding MarR family transcriptional regulator
VTGIDAETLRRVVPECPGFQARATARAVTRFYNARFKSLGLTAEQFSLLVGIGADAGTLLADLALSAGVDTTALSRSVGILERRGLIHGEGGRGRAGKRLSLTPAGRQLVAAALPLWRQATAELAEEMGENKLGAAKRRMAELGAAAEGCSAPVPRSTGPRE